MRRTVLAIGSALALAACGGGEIPESDVRQGDVPSGRPTTYRDGGEPVSGTVVRKTQDGQLMAETQYEDGYPTSFKEWYANGQIQAERQVKLVKSDKGQSLQPIGTSRGWCENGTLEEESGYDFDGTPIGTHQRWTCSGKQLLLETFPSGPFRSWQELDNGEVVLNQEGDRLESRHWDGEHKVYGTDGKLTLLESWKDAKQDGDYKRWSPNGRLEESGRYEAGNKVGLWTFMLGDNQQLWDYDAKNFMDQEYAAAFMQAAGIEPPGQSGVLQEYQVDLEKLEYYVKEGRVDPTRKINFDTNTRYNEWKSHLWTYPYVRASSGALAKLRELGADPKATDSEQRSRLHYCISSMYHGTCTTADVKALLELGLDAKQADERGYTPLHLLLRSGSVRDPARGSRPATLADHQPLIELLLAAGADVDAQDHEGFTPVMLALRARMYDVATALLDKTQKPELISKDGYNLIQLVFVIPGVYQVDLELSDERKAFIEAAVKKGVDPKAKLANGDTLAQVAEKNGAIDTAKYLAGLGG